MAKLAFTVEVEAPPDRVGVFFVPQRMPYWYGAEMEAHFTMLAGAADFAPGQKVEIRGNLRGREMSLTAVVGEYRMASVLEWQFQDRYGVRGMQRWEIAPRGDASTVRMRDEYELPGWLGRVVDRLLTRHAVAQRDRGYLARLKRLAEHR
jgi:hypothetical protein